MAFRRGRLDSKPLLMADCHGDWVTALVGLSDGSSFVSCSCDRSVKRWSLSSDPDRQLHHVGTYSGHTGAVRCAVEGVSNNTLITC